MAINWNSSMGMLNASFLEPTSPASLTNGGQGNNTLVALTSSLPGPVVIGSGAGPEEVVISNMPHVLIPQTIWRVFQVLHAVLTVVALTTNCVSLLVIYGIVPRLTPPLQALTSLAFADMLAPWAIMTIYFPPSACQDEIHTALLLTAHNAGALSLLILAGCHYVATFRPLHYDKIMTQKRLWIVINVIWISAILAAHIHFLAVLTRHNSTIPFCIQVLETTKIPLTIAACLCGALLVVGGVIYTRIFMELRPISTLADQNTQPRKCTRSVVTGMLLAGTFLITWVPYLVAKFVQIRNLVEAQHNAALVIVLHACQTLILLNCILNPIVYGVRMDAMQTGYLGLYHKTRSWIISVWHRISGKVDGDDQPSTPLNPIESIC